MLAGGRSVRMGTDKALLRYEGTRLVDRAVAHLQRLCDDVVVAAGPRVIPELRVPQVPDRPTGTGPLGGLAAGLAEAEGDVAFVLAVDLPEPDLDFLARLAAYWQGEAAIVPTAAGYPQPLHAVWATSCAPALSLLAASGTRSLVDAARQLDATILCEAQTAALVDHDRWAWNLNRPSDLEAGSA